MLVFAPGLPSLLKRKRGRVSMLLERGWPRELAMKRAATLMLASDQQALTSPDQALVLEEAILVNKPTLICFCKWHGSRGCGRVEQLVGTCSCGSVSFASTTLPLNKWIASSRQQLELRRRLFRDRRSRFQKRRQLKWRISSWRRDPDSRGGADRRRGADSEGEGTD
ncbi:uncharacterized protein A4U43_C09F10120 [Asparagus officinalis]|uniref:Uncharacterized protein n=1 Tax=Asparagus officinalis TaxID=4686 RepID=A0A5P1E9Q1_ASPOF|nr:uncharacterized protein A4U43_C09F10120 [Asparagus officinalis]